MSRVTALAAFGVFLFVLTAVFNLIGVILGLGILGTVILLGLLVHAALTQSRRPTLTRIRVPAREPDTEDVTQAEADDARTVA